MKRALSFSVILFLLFSCKIKEDFTPYNFNGEIIVFGGGGGFSGKVYQYTLMENGQFFKGTHQEGKVHEFDRVNERQVEQLFNSYHQLGFGDLELNESGNLYKFLKFYMGDKEHKIMWPDANIDEHTTLKVYHDNLMALARKANRNSSEIRANQPIK